MESLAYIHNAVAYESNDPLPELQPLLANWEIPNSTWIATSSLVVSLLVIGVQEASATVTGVVQTGGATLNVRQEPDGPVVATVPNGSTLQLTGRAQGGWLEQADGTWVMAQYVQSAPAEATTTAQGSGVKVAYARTNGAPLNVRNSPSGAVVGSIPNGSQVELTGRSSNGWLERADGTWVAAQYVQSTPPGESTTVGTVVNPVNPSPTATASPSPQGTAVRTGYVSTGGNPLNFRRSPGGEVVGRLANGTQVELTGREQNGYLERTDGSWVQSQYIQFTPPSPTAQNPSPAPSPNSETTTATVPSPPSPPPPAPSPEAQSAPTPQAQNSPAPSPSPTAQGSNVSTATVRTNGSPLNVRSSPGGAIVASIPNGTVIELSGRRSGDWVERSNNTWVSSNWIAMGGTTPPPDQGSDVTVAFVRTNGTPLNVRSSPGGAVVGTLPNGTRIELTGRRSGEWAQRTNGTWVSSNWISTTGTTPPPDQGGDASTAFVRTNGTPLNVRSSPGGAVVGTLPNGTRIELTGRQSGEWAQRTNGTWVSSNWISTTGTTPPPDQGGDASTAFVRTNGTPLNVRSSPGGAVVGTLPNGARVELNGRRSGEWVQRTNGTWVSNNWLSTTTTPTPEPPIGGPEQTAVVATNGSPLLVRSSPGGRVVGEYANGTRITLNGRSSGSWLQLSNGNWVSGDWVTRLSR